MEREEMYMRLLLSQLMAAEHMALEIRLESEHDLYEMHRQHLVEFIERLRVDLERM